MPIWSTDDWLDFHVAHSPDEYAFTSPLPEPILPPLDFVKFLQPNDINVNDKIMNIYVKDIVPTITKSGDDMNYGSSVTKDIEALQALSKRIHFGKAVTPYASHDLSTHSYFCRQVYCRVQI